MELILNTYGVTLNRDNEGFVITSDTVILAIEKGNGYRLY